MDFLMGLGIFKVPRLVVSPLSLGFLSLESDSLRLSTLVTSSASLSAGSKSDLKSLINSMFLIVTQTYLQ